MKIRGKRGITLISLVVTIVVMLILAGVSIGLLLGDNGIINQASRAKQASEKSSIIEEIQIDIASKQTENLGSINEDEFYEILGKYGTVSEKQTKLTTTKGNYEILISDIYSGNIESSLVTTPIESWEYRTSGTDIILTKYIGSDAKIFIPDIFIVNGITYNTKMNTTNETGPFLNNLTIKEVKFGENVECINYNGYAMLFECKNLEKVYNLPSNITSLQSTFGNCSSLIKVPIIGSKITIMNWTFSGCTKLSGTITIEAENITNVEGCFANRKDNKIVLKVNKNSTTYQTFNEHIEEWTNVIFEGEEVVNIACWGDSLTAGAGSTNVTYSKKLQELAGRFANVTKLGVGGESSKSIAIRQGAIPIYTNTFTIPATTVKVEISIKDGNGNSVTLARQGKDGLNPVTISGIEGNIEYNSTTSKYEFTRTTAGTETLIQDNTQIITSGMKSYRDDLMIIWAGTNDKPNSTTIQNTINNINSMLEYSNNDKYIVIGLTSKKYMIEVEQVNNKLNEAYGEHFLDIRTYILQNGLSDAGITETSQDTADLTDGEIPTSLRKDDVHFNDYGYTIVGTQVYNKLISLGYIAK